MGKWRKQGSRLSVKAIIKDKDNWARYQEAYAAELSPNQIAEVEKMLGCGDPKKGFASYICLRCGEQVSVPFSCKSRVCSSCGQVHADEWAKQMASRMFNVTHRHITFTVPAVLWPHLENHPEWRKELFLAANATLRKVMQVEPGIVMVMHPYGKDLKPNYHLHALVSEGGLNEKGAWQSQSYLNYKALRKVWQYEVLSRLRGVMKSDPKEKALINQLFEAYRQGFYVHAEPRVSNQTGISRYIGRYIRHPAIADSRIVSYDGEQVSFVYDERGKGGKKRQKQVTLPVLAFIHGVVRHIPPKHFKLVRYYGLYAPRKESQVKARLVTIGRAVGRAVRRLSWPERIRRAFKREPLTCPRCGEPDMELYSLTVLVKGRLVTIGGMKWLFERGSIREVLDKPPPPLIQVGPQPIQLGFNFSAAP